MAGPGDSLGVASAYHVGQDRASDLAAKGNKNMTQIQYYFATISPYAYLMGDRLEKVAAKHGAEIEYRVMDLPQVFQRTGGLPPKDRHPSRQAWRLQELTRQSAKLGMNFNLQPAHWPTNAAPSSYAFISAQNHGADGDLGQLARAILRSCWADELDIAQPDVIAACLTEAGFDPALADKDMLGSAETYTKNTDMAVENGVFGAPFFITQSGQKLWGQDRVEDLDLILSGKL